MESPAAAPSTPVPTLKFRGRCRRSAKELAGDLKSADVNAVYTEKLPYYEVPPTTASDYRDVQVLETVDHSRVGIEDGDKDQTGTCYSVDVALTANFALAGGAASRGRHQGVACGTRSFPCHESRPLQAGRRIALKE